MTHSADRVMRNIRAALAGYFDWKKTWRASKAEQYPHDTRNAASVAALGDLIAFIKALPTSDDIFRRLAKMPLAFTDRFEVFSMSRCNGEPTPFDYRVSRYGFDGAENPREFLSSWVDELVEYYPEFKREWAEAAT